MKAAHPGSSRSLDVRARIAKRDLASSPSLPVTSTAELYGTKEVIVRHPSVEIAYEHSICDEHSSRPVSDCDLKTIPLQSSQPFRGRGCLLQFENAQVERGFSRHLANTYNSRTALYVVTLLVTHISIWMLLGVSMRNSDLGWGSLHMIGSLGAFTILMNSLSPLVNLCGIGPEYWAYLTLIPTFVLWAIWFFIILARFVHEDSVTHTSTPDEVYYMLCYNVDTAMTLLVVAYALAFDLILATRIRYSLGPHLLILISCLALATQRMLFVSRQGVVQTFQMIINWTPVLFNVLFLLFAYLGRAKTEKCERLTFLASQADRFRIEDLIKRHVNRRKAHGETLIETLIYRLKRARLFLQKAAFERHRTGDLGLLEANEILSSCHEALLNADTFCQVGQGYSQADIDYRKELRYVKLLAGSVEVSALQEKRLAGEDLSSPPQGVERIYWTDQRLPCRTMARDVSCRVGVDPFLSILGLADQYPHILVEIGSIVLEPYLFHMRIQEITLRRYLAQLQAHYHWNPYHSAVHGAMVAHMFQVILGLLDWLTPHVQMSRDTPLASDSSAAVWTLEVAACLIACLAHDVGHPGRNNTFQLNCRSIISMAYGETSVLERFHTFLCFRLALISRETNVFQGLSNREYRDMRELIIHAILDTDTSRHFSTISKFRARRNAEDFDALRNPQDVRLSLRMIVKLADISHGVLNWQEHQLWSYRVASEFYQQGLDEKRLGLPLSPLCNVWEHAKFAKSQAGFLEYVVTPLADEVAILDASGNYHNNVLTRLCYNRYRWSVSDRAGAKVAIPPDLLTIQLPSFEVADRLWLMLVRARSVEDINSSLETVSLETYNEYPTPTATVDGTTLSRLLNTVLAQMPPPTRKPFGAYCTGYLMNPVAVKLSHRTAHEDCSLSPDPPPMMPYSAWPDTPTALPDLASSCNLSVARSIASNRALTAARGRRERAHTANVTELRTHLPTFDEPTPRSDLPSFANPLSRRATAKN